MKSFKYIFSIISLATLLIYGIGSPALVGAAGTDSTATSKAEVCQGLGEVSGSGSCNYSGANSSLSHVLKEVLDILSLIVGIIATIMIVIAGVKFILSGGESQQVASARNTILFAVIGLVVVACAQLIVHFVLNRISSK